MGWADDSEFTTQEVTGEEVSGAEVLCRQSSLAIDLGEALVERCGGTGLGEVVELISSR